MRRVLGSAELGASSLCGASHSGDECGSNGLPLTPSGVRMLGQFQKLKNIDHVNLCKYVHLEPSKHERVLIVAEHYKTSLEDVIRTGEWCRDKSKIVSLVYGILQGLSHLNQQGLVHRNLSPRNILIDPQGGVKLSAYGVYHMTHHGADVKFPIGRPKYMAPETLCQGPVTLTDPAPCSDEPRHASQPHSAPTADVWALGLILLEAYWGLSLWSTLSLTEVLEQIFTFVTSDCDPLSLITDHHQQHGSGLKTLPTDLAQFVGLCLTVSPLARPLPSELLQHVIFRNCRKTEIPSEDSRSMIDSATPQSLSDYDLASIADIKYKEVDYLPELTLDEVFYLWTLAGGDLEGVLNKAALIRNRPPITKLSKFLVVEGDMFGEPKDHSTLLDDTVVILPLDELRQRIQQIDPMAYYPLLENDTSKIPQLSGQMHTSLSSGDLGDTSKLPLVIREKDVEYQFQRIVLYSKLLRGCPHTKHRILREARVDIPPFVRAPVWAELLHVPSNVQEVYDGIDKETPTATDRQIEVDIPRCHQYSGLLSSPAGHHKFKRVLKAWVITHPHYVYWQGLDSLCAPFLTLNFNNEALAYACLTAFIPKYLKNFFLKDNSAVIQEYLAVFSHLIAFHDPELSNHLDGIGFVPELYAIPWFLTMFAHVFPLHKVFHLWDTLLLGNSSFPLYIGVAILQQLREQLLCFGFNECILLFSDMPEIVIEKVVQDSVKLFRTTPRSATYREHAPPDKIVTNGNKTNSESIEESQHFTRGASLRNLAIDSISLEDLKRERCPRISAEDLLKLCELHLTGSSPVRGPTPRRSNKSDKPPLIVLDIRPQEYFLKGTIPGSLNLPFTSAFTPDGALVPSPAVTTLANFKYQVKVIIGGYGDSAIVFSEKLLKLGYSKICVLHKGIDSIKHSGFLTVPPVTEF